MIIKINSHPKIQGLQAVAIVITLCAGIFLDRTGTVALIGLGLGIGFAIGIVIKV